MRYTPFVGVLAAVCLAAPARAEVIVNTPWVSVRVGRPLPPPVVVDLPPVILPGDPPPVPLPPPIQVDPPPVPVLGPPAPASVRPPTLEEFASSFQPAPGSYEVVLMHPVTCCPVKVCFSLPPGCPCKVRVRARALVFSYGLCDKIVLRFYRDGSVQVRD